MIIKFCDMFNNNNSCLIMNHQGCTAQSASSSFAYDIEDRCFRAGTKMEHYAYCVHVHAL